MLFDMILLERFFAAFLIGFPAMFSIVNPIGKALTFLNMTSDRSHVERWFWRDALGYTRSMFCWVRSGLAHMFWPSLVSALVRCGSPEASQLAFRLGQC